ncbi:hypothetical protein WR164_02660 [Philodulcilactobacillus myokoensis]|uniref:DUF805 domain-containing protein n=1 Tax=Philodulcilactobacillus myokoensis TaxID=2929573 RepID=A0A9W6AZV0_9LACO|nr:DUF805 domain-containing protein [Philodulcilactobacillus myokoensis]GLB46287.1 hypothetical protein WR164_02660 [Philodulcilactobacillus myokoensis]
MQNGEVNFIAAYKMYWKHYFNFKSHSSRLEFWWVVIWDILVSMVILLFFGTMIPVIHLSGLKFVMSIWVLINYIPGMSLTVRRYHDLGISGFWYLLTPFLGNIIMHFFSNFARLYYQDGMQHIAFNEINMTLYLIGLVINLISFILAMKKTKWHHNRYLK